MRAAILRSAFVAACALAGLALAPRAGLAWAAGLGIGALGGLAGLALEAALRPLPQRRLAGVAVGAGAGLALAALLRLAAGPALDAMAWPLGGALTVAVLAYAGGMLGADRMPSSLAAFAPGARRGADAHAHGEHAHGEEARGQDARGSGPRREPAAERGARGSTKVVDTSVIIDGRIADVVESGFIDGAVVIPQFVLRELQHVADSSDPLKRNRGRKGLDVLRALQASDRITVEFTSEDTSDVKDVDAKLLWLAERRAAKVLTNDYNLNKIAQLKGIEVLNVNDLANAVRPVVLPGEALTIQVIKEGKERNQGVGYLDDGTMVVVENGRRLLGQKLVVLVTSVIQTNAGKMIFATAEDEELPEVRPRVLRRMPERDPREMRDVGDA